MMTEVERAEWRGRAKDKTIVENGVMVCIQARKQTNDEQKWGSCIMF